MNSDNLNQLLQQGFRITLGATASLVETLQNPQKQTENLHQLQLELSQLTAEWAVKGEMTEQEARNFVDHLLSQLGRSGSPPAASPSVVIDPLTQRSAGGGSGGGVEQSQAAPASSAQLNLQELTAQIAAIRAELEKLRNSGSDPS